MNCVCIKIVLEINHTEKKAVNTDTRNALLPSTLTHTSTGSHEISKPHSQNILKREAKGKYLSRKTDKQIFIYVLTV